MCPWTMGQIGWPNPNPIVNTSPFGIVYDNVLHNLYRDINNQISEMSFDGTNWNYGNFSKKLSSPVPPLSNGDPYAMVFNNNGNKSRHFLYRDVNNEISDIWFYEPNSQWAYQNLHTLVSASNPPLANGNPCSVQFNVTLQNSTVIYMQHNVFLDENDLISDIWFSGKTNKWYYQNLNTLVSSYNSPFAKGNPFAIIYNGQHHNLYRDKNDAISDIWYDPVKTKWSYQNLNTLVSASNPPLAKGNPFSVIYADGQHNLYLDANGKISDIWYNGISWLYQNLHNLVASSNPASAKGNPFSVVCNTSHQHNLYLDINSKISDIWYDGSNWWYQNLHDLASSYNPPLAIGDPFVVVYGNQRHHFYRDTNYQMSDIWYDGSIWHYQAWIV